MPRTCPGAEASPSSPIVLVVVGPLGWSVASATESALAEGCADGELDVLDGLVAWRVPDGRILTRPLLNVPRSAALPTQAWGCVVDQVVRTLLPTAAVELEAGYVVVFCAGRKSAASSVTAELSLPATVTRVVPVSSAEFARLRAGAIDFRSA